MNGPLNCPFCGTRPTHWYVEEGVPYVVCDNHSEPIRMRLSDWNVRRAASLTKEKPISDATYGAQIPSFKGGPLTKETP